VVKKIIFFIGLGCLGVWLWVVFSGVVVLGQGFSLGFLTVRYYGLMLALAAICGYYFALRRGEQAGLTQHFIERLFFVVLVFGFAGARLYHVVSEFGRYQGHLLDAFKVWQGGLGIYGAVFGGVLGLIVFLWYERQLSFSRLFTVLDVLAPSMLVGQIIGRFGNFFNYELYGYPTTLVWKMFVPLQFRLPGYESFAYFHPLFLYEALGNTLILLLLLRIEPLGKRASGSLFFLMFFMYTILRFFLEFIRLDSVFIGGFRINAYISLALALCALGLFVFRNWRLSQG
jgi:phosphatidylglycerol:prolipoprotein diacylglycerol transferase